MEKITFIYGFTGSKKDSKIAKRILSDYDVICFEYDSKLKQSIEQISLKLDDFINSNINKKEKINLIGISAGGIIASYYAKFVSPKKVNKLATICSPFKGTYVPYFYSKKRKGLKELAYNSTLLKKISSKKLDKNKAINFYSYFDILVLGKSGKGDNPVCIWNFFHFTIQNDENIYKKIKKFFEK